MCRLIVRKKQTGNYPATKFSSFSISRNTRVYLRSYFPTVSMKVHRFLYGLAALEWHTEFTLAAYIFETAPIDVVSAIVKHRDSKFGMPQTVQTDNCAPCTSLLFIHVCDETGALAITTSEYDLQSNENDERLNFTLYSRYWHDVPETGRSRVKFLLLSTYSFKAKGQRFRKLLQFFLVLSRKRFRPTLTRIAAFSAKESEKVCRTSFPYPCRLSG